MPFSRESLNRDEEVVLDLHPHWWFFVPQVLALVAAVAIGVATLAWDPLQNRVLQIIALILIVAALAWLLIRYVVWNTTNFVITTDRLINRSGVIRREGIEIPLERVNTVFFSQTVFERLIGAGDLVIESAGEQGAQTVNDIRKPLNVQNEIYRQMEANENRKFDRVGRNLDRATGGAQGGGGGGSGPSIPEQIEKLAELYRQGVLTDAEFQSKKKELLDRM